MLNSVVSLEETPGEGISSKAIEKTESKNLDQSPEKRQSSSSPEGLDAVAEIAGAATIATKASAIKKSCMSTATPE